MLLSAKQVTPSLSDPSIMDNLALEHPLLVLTPASATPEVHYPYAEPFPGSFVGLFANTSSMVEQGMHLDLPHRCNKCDAVRHPPTEPLLEISKYRNCRKCRALFALLKQKQRIRKNELQSNLFYDPTKFFSYCEERHNLGARHIQHLKLTVTGSHPELVGLAPIYSAEELADMLARKDHLQLFDRVKQYLRNVFIQPLEGIAGLKFAIRSSNFKKNNKVYLLLLCCGDENGLARTKSKGLRGFTNKKRIYRCELLIIINYSPLDGTVNMEVNHRHHDACEMLDEDGNVVRPHHVVTPDVHSAPHSRPASALLHALHRNSPVHSPMPQYYPNQVPQGQVPQGVPNYQQMMQAHDLNYDQSRRQGPGPGLNSNDLAQMVAAHFMSPGVMGYPVPQQQQLGLQQQPPHMGSRLQQPMQPQPMQPQSMPQSMQQPMQHMMQGHPPHIPQPVYQHPLRHQMPQGIDEEHLERSLEME